MTSPMPTYSAADAGNQAAAGPRRKISIMTRWPTEENPSAVFSHEVYHPVAAPMPWLPPVDYDDEEEEEVSNDKNPTASSLSTAQDRSVEFQQQQTTSLEERQLRRKISISNITGKARIPSRRRSVIEFSQDFQRQAAANAAGSQVSSGQGLRPQPATVPE